MSQPLLEMNLAAQNVGVPPAPRPLSALVASSSSSSSSSPATTNANAVSRAAKSGNGSGNNTTGILKAGSSAATHAHNNAHRATKRAGSTSSSHAQAHAHTHAHPHGHAHIGHAGHAGHASHASHASHAGHAHAHAAHSPGHDNDGRPKRVWKACERCRMKKTKCDGEFPCKRCKDDGLVCTAGTRKKTEYKQIPKGYAEVLENTQVALVATIHKLYAMVQSGQAWTLGEPELNERGQPVIHSIASKLGCIRPNNDPDLPFGSSIFPESDKDLADLQSQLNDYHKQREAEQQEQQQQQQQQQQQAAAAHPELDMSVIKQEAICDSGAALPSPLSATTPTVATAAARKRLSAPAVTSSTSSSNLGFDTASASSPEDLENLSDMDDYSKNVFGRGGRAGSSVQSASTMSPQSLTFNDFDSVATTSQPDCSSSVAAATIPSPATATPFTNWMAQASDLGALQSTQQAMDFQMRQRLAQHLQNNKLQFLQQQQQQQQSSQQQQQQQQSSQQQQQQQQQQVYDGSPLTSLSMAGPLGAAANMTLLGANANFFTADLLQQGLFESNFGAIKPHIINTDAMLGGADPMIFDGGYDEPLL